MAMLNCFLMMIKGVSTLKIVPAIYHLSFYSVNGMELLLLFVCQFHDIAILFTSCSKRKSGSAITEKC